MQGTPQGSHPPARAPAKVPRRARCCGSVQAWGQICGHRSCSSAVGCTVSGGRGGAGSANDPEFVRAAGALAPPAPNSPSPLCPLLEVVPPPSKRISSAAPTSPPALASAARASASDTDGRTSRTWAIAAAREGGAAPPPCEPRPICTAASTAWVTRSARRRKEAASQPIRGGQQPGKHAAWVRCSDWPSVGLAARRRDGVLRRRERTTASSMSTWPPPALPMLGAGLGPWAGGGRPPVGASPPLSHSSACNGGLLPPASSSNLHGHVGIRNMARARILPDGKSTAGTCAARGRPVPTAA
jgi:hypothetical protein